MRVPEPAAHRRCRSLRLGASGRFRRGERDGRPVYGMGGLDGLGGRIGGQETTSRGWTDSTDGYLHVCQGEGRGFESRRPLSVNILASQGYFHASWSLALANGLPIVPIICPSCPSFAHQLCRRGALSRAEDDAVRRASGSNDKSSRNLARIVLDAAGDCIAEQGESLTLRERWSPRSSTRRLARRDRISPRPRDQLTR